MFCGDTSVSKANYRAHEEYLFSLKVDLVPFCTSQPHSTGEDHVHLEDAAMLRSRLAYIGYRILGVMDDVPHNGPAITGVGKLISFFGEPAAGNDEEGEEKNRRGDRGEGVRQAGLCQASAHQNIHSREQQTLTLLFLLRY